MNPLVYIAGPYTHPDPLANTRRAVGVMHAMLDTGAMTPVCPHLSFLADFVRTRPVDDWYAYDIELLRRCDAMYLLPGESAGAAAEVRFAEAKGIPVFIAGTDDDLGMLEHVVRWADARRENGGAA